MTLPDPWDLLAKFGPSLTAVTITGLLSTWQARRKRRQELEDQAAKAAAEGLAKAEAAAESERQARIQDAIGRAHDAAETALKEITRVATELRAEFTAGHHRIRADTANSIGEIGNRVLAVEKAVSAVEAVLKERTP